MAEQKDIVYETLLSKLLELERTDKIIDQQYTKDKKELRVSIDMLRTHLDQLKINKKGTGEIVKVRKAGRQAQPLDPNNYPYIGSLRNKMLFAIVDSNRFLHIQEIAQYILDKEPGKNKSVIIDQLSKNMYKHKDRGTVAAFRAGASNRNVFYGLPEWLDKDGGIREGYEFDKKALIDSPVAQLGMYLLNSNRD